MFKEVLLFLLGLWMILLSCELFTNSIEWIGARLKVGDGVVGSIFSAVGTCLPETSIPVMAILIPNVSSHPSDICMGAIMGAPFMLGTLAFFVTGISVILFRRKRKTGLFINIHYKMLIKELLFFLGAYTIGVVASFLPMGIPRIVSLFVLIFGYVFYLIITIRQGGGAVGFKENLYLQTFFKKASGWLLVWGQLLLALAGIVMGAELFVGVTERLSHRLGISALILALVITPIATELPEKFNSILWIKRNKDALAIGNITGAMVFQSCIPISIGIAATPWQFDKNIVFGASMLMTYIAGVTLWILRKRAVHAFPLLFGGLIYVAFIMKILLLGNY